MELMVDSVDQKSVTVVKLRLTVLNFHSQRVILVLEFLLRGQLTHFPKDLSAQ